MKIGLPSPQLKLKPLRLYICLLFSALFLTSFTGGGEDDDKSPLPGPKRTSEIIKNRLLNNRLASGDPVYFILTANKKYVKQGEEVEFTISAHYIEDAHKTFLVYKELYGYTLKLIMPNGFVVTGGTYHDQIQGKVSKHQPSQTYTLKGYFENECENCEFKLLRGTYDHLPGEQFVYKQSVFLNVPQEINIASKKKAKSTIDTKELNIEDVNSVAATQASVMPNQPLLNAQVCTTTSFSALANSERFDYNDPSCVKEVSSPSWYIIKVTGAGSLKYNIYSEQNQDVDFVCYGPYSGTSDAAINSLKQRTWSQIKNDPIQDASFHSRSIEYCTWDYSTVGNCNNGSKTSPASVGLYVLMVSNYSNMASHINIVKNGGTAITDCGVGGVDCTTPPTLSSSTTTVIRGNDVSLTVSGCDTDIVWKRGTTDLGNNTATYTAAEQGNYVVTCKRNGCTGTKTSNTITVTHSGTPGLTSEPSTSTVLPGQSVKLTASGCNGKYQWNCDQLICSQSNANEIYVSGPGTYSVKCVNYNNPSIYSGETTKTIGTTVGNTPSLTQEGTICLRSGEVKNITATCNTGYTVTWVDENNSTTNSTSNQSSTITVGSGTYYAKCCSGSTCSAVGSITVCSDSSPHPCTTLPTPVVTLNPERLKMGEFFTLSVSGCTGTITWYKGKFEAANRAGLSSFWTNENDSYYATCTYSDCNNTVKTSNSVSPSYVPLTIEHDVPNNEVVSGVHFKLTAVGCASGMVEWYTAAGTTRYENPIWEPFPGLYKARCIDNGTAFSDWVSVFFNLRTATTPQFSKPDQCYYANQKLYISGTCPTGMEIRWNDGSVSTTFPNYHQVVPGTYSAQCCNGSSCSGMASVSVCTITPTISQINTDKDDPLDGKAYAAPNEAVLLTATGCPYGVVHWWYNGQTQSGNPITVYGPGTYYARCFVTDHSTSPMINRTVYPKAPGEVSITASQSSAFPNDIITLTASGCNAGTVNWTYTVGTTTYNKTGRRIDVMGPNTYYATCIVSGITGPRSNINIPLASGKPRINVDKTQVRPNETFTFQVDFSACPSYGWPGGSTNVTQNGVTTNMWGWNPITLTGPAVLEAQCGNASWQKQKREVLLAPGDNLRLVANKIKVGSNEAVLLTTYGCDYGYIEWEIGTTIITGSMADPKREITQYGPGVYKARCKNDFNINSEQVTAIVGLDGNIVPAIDGPTTLCPNSAGTVTTPGCPSGYYNAWSTLEQGGFSYGGNSITVYLPQTVKLRCHKNDNSWTSDEKLFTIQPAIPDDIKATSNSPVVSGGTAQLAGTAITGATYLWTPPAGVTLTVPLNARTLTITNVTEAHAGEYKLKVTKGGCEIEVSVQLAVNLCDNLYIKAFDPLTGEEKYKLARKTGLVNEYDNLVLQVETFEGQTMKGVEYTWTYPTGITGTVDPTAPYKTTINKVGNYKVNVTSAGGISCPLDVDISALVCATPADFTNCGATGTVASSGTEKLKNLAVGDEFSTYDYIVTVTEVSGSEATGWTGRGELNMNFLKIGGSPVIEIPLAVEFAGINLNQCYQLLDGPKVKTSFDESWSNVVDVDETIKNLLTDISDILTNYDPSDNAKLLELSNELDSQISEVLSNPDLSDEQKNMITTALNNATSSIGCLVSNNSGARTVTGSCTVETVQSTVENSMIGVEAANDRDCNCPKPTTTAIEGDKIVASGTKNIVSPFVGATTIACKKTWIYHSSYQGAKYPSGWYYSEDYEEIETFVHDKIGPLIFVHGTFSDPSTFSDDFEANVHKYLKMSLTKKEAIAQFQWSGGNTVADREAAAIEMGITLNSAISKNILKKLGYEKHIILVCHSHGGNVAKRVKNILEGYDPAWTVDVINIETPQRSDFQFSSTKGKVLNFWSDGDLVQWAGSIADFELSLPSPGPLGSRKDPKADKNIQLLPKQKINLEAYGAEAYQWIMNSLGHSLQGDDWYKAQIYHHINKTF